MNCKLYTCGIVLVLLAVVANGCVTGVETAANEPTVGLVNPASVYCQEQGYTLETRTGTDGGQYGVCLFPDGSECEEWAFYRGECKPTPAPVATDTPEATPTTVPIVAETPTQAPKPTSTPEIDDPYTGWESYVNLGYGFAFRYPTTWTIEEEANLVKLSQGKLLLAIAFQRQGEDVPPPWSGMPAGEFESRGTLPFLGQEIAMNALIYEGKVKVLTYSAQVEDLLFSMRLDDMATADYQTIDISETTRNEVDRIVGSFSLPESGGF